MKKHLITLLLLAFFVLCFSCVTTNKLIRNKLQSLGGREDISVVLCGNPFFGDKWKADTVLSHSGYFSYELEKLLESRISLINSSLPADTFLDTKKRAQVDILSFRPDIVFIMLGFVEANLMSISETTFRAHVKELFDILQENKTFTIVLTASGQREDISRNEMRTDRLNRFNEIILWEAGNHNFPVLDVAEYMERLRTTALEEYNSLFMDEYQYNEKGQKYIVDYILKRLRRAVKKDSDTTHHD